MQDQCYTLEVSGQVAMVLLSIYALFQGWLAAAGWVLAFNIPINAYPVMLQRYNRIRLTQLIRRQVT